MWEGYLCFSHTVEPPMSIAVGQEYDTLTHSIKNKRSNIRHSEEGLEKQQELTNCLHKNRWLCFLVHQNGAC